MVSQETSRRRERLAVNQTRAKEMRHDPVFTEKLFWSLVRNRQLGGFKFRRQYLIGPYIVDFVCLERRVIVELDGELHEGREGYDARRDAYLRAQGFRVERIRNADLISDLPTTMRGFHCILETCEPRESPSPPQGERVG
jgi:very-short-patch-repair endonuclease